MDKELSTASSPAKPILSLASIHINVLYLTIDYLMPILTQAPRPRFARPGANPGLAKVEAIREILRKARRPVSRNQLLAELKNWGMGMNRPGLNAVLDFLGSEGQVIQGSHGLEWVPAARGRILKTILRKRKSGRRKR